MQAGDNKFVTFFLDEFNSFQNSAIRPLGSISHGSSCILDDTEDSNGLCNVFARAGRRGKADLGS